MDDSIPISREKIGEWKMLNPKIRALTIFYKKIIILNWQGNFILHINYKSVQ